MATMKKSSSTDETAKVVDTFAARSKQAADAGSKAVQKNYEQAFAQTKEQVEKASGAMFKSYDELATLNKENVDAVVKFGAIFAKGYETLGKEMMAFAQSALESNAQATKALFGAKNLNEMLELQAQFTRKSFDDALTESAKLAELSVQVTNEAMQPIQTRVNATMERVMKPMAA